jgi:hypothetical protein
MDGVILQTLQGRGVRYKPEAIAELIHHRVTENTEKKGTEGEQAVMYPAWFFFLVFSVLSVTLW